MLALRIEQRGSVTKGGHQARNLCHELLGIVDFERLGDARKYLRRIRRLRREEQVAVPRPPWEAGRVEKRPFRFDQRVVEQRG